LFATPASVFWRALPLPLFAVGRHTTGGNGAIVRGHGSTGFAKLNLQNGCVFSGALFDGDGDFQDVSSFRRTPLDGNDQYD